MSPPTSFILPSRVHNTFHLPQTSIPLLITSDTACELVTFAVTYAQSSLLKRQHVLITSQDCATITTTLTSSLLTHASSFLTSAPLMITADAITVYHVNTLAQLRVLLCTLQHSHNIDLLGVDNFLHLHGQAEELSAQGISRTLAAMVQITSSSNGVLVLREPSAALHRPVPILNAGVSSGVHAPATTPVLRILGRWIRGFWNQERSGEGENSAEWICRGEKWRMEWTLVNGEIEDVQISFVE